MGRHSKFPDVNYCSVNEPSVLIQPTIVLALYNQEHVNDKKGRVTQDVLEWVVNKAKEQGWSDCRVTGNQCLLTARFNESNEVLKHAFEKQAVAAGSFASLFYENQIDSDKRNWIEDFPHENGNYVNKCSICSNQFIGHKHRVVCKLC